ncbi:MAG: 3-phosphoshikimate 1-carboxyvinyltransferase [Nitriliruptorales bacterium]|nr:3-phosphoshikimate 1-carboxyvinyltransferase [Nitriliruptorales bacterium]
MSGPDASTLVQLKAGSPLSGTLAAPASKSLTNRALIAAALASGTSVLHGVLASDDTAAMRGAVGALGAVIEDGPGVVRIGGTAGAPGAPDRPVDARLSGTTMRFVIAMAALVPTRATVTGQQPLLRRPVAPLTAALRALGAQAQDAAGFPPATVGGGIAGGEVIVDIAASSQFVSAVLLVAPYARRDVIVSAVGQAADAYIEMTVDLMRRWGAVVLDEAPRRWRVVAGAGYRAQEEAVDYDASAAAHLFCLAAATAGRVTVTNALPTTLQPDAQIADVLREMGCDVLRDGNALMVTGPARLQPVEVDMAAMPDQVTTVAALAVLAHGRTVIRGAAVTRGHETNRLAALATELRKLGVPVQEHPDGLTIHGGSAAGPARLATYGDHRLAMAFAAIAARVPGVAIEDPGCVRKTYPDFWDDVTRLGGVVRFGR